MKTLTVLTSLQDVTAVLSCSLSILTDAFYNTSGASLTDQGVLEKASEAWKVFMSKKVMCSSQPSCLQLQFDCLCADSVLLHLSGGSKCLNPFMNRAFHNQKVEKHTYMRTHSYICNCTEKSGGHTSNSLFAMSSSEERTGQLRVKGNFCLSMLLKLSFQLAYTWVLFDYFKNCLCACDVYGYFLEDVC